MLYSVNMSGRHIYIGVDDNANNGNSGLRPSESLKSLNRALQVAMPNDTLLLGEGVYNDRFVIQKNGLTIMPYQDAKVTLTNSNLIRSKENKLVWKLVKKVKHKITKRSYSVYHLKLKNKPKAVSYIIDKDGHVYWTYRNKLEFETQYIFTDQNIEVQGVFFDGKNVFLTSEEDPNKLDLSLASDRILELYNVENFSINGGEKRQIEVVNAGNYGLVINNSQNGNIKISGLKFENVQNAIKINNHSSGQISIENNGFFGLSSISVPWQLHKSGIDKKQLKGIPKSYLFEEPIDASYDVLIMSTNAILINSNCNGDISIRNNDIKNYFNGVVATSGNTIIDNNRISDIQDDAIEIEGYTPNVIVSNNYVKSSFVSLSLIPIFEGPVFVFNNTFINDQSAFEWKYDYLKKTINYKDSNILKFFSDGSKNRSNNVHLYHNTFYAQDDVLHFGSVWKPEYNPTNSSFYNNIFISKYRLVTDYAGWDDGISLEGNMFFNAQNPDRKSIRNKQTLKKDRINEIIKSKKDKVPNFWRQVELDDLSVDRLFLSEKTYEEIMDQGYKLRRLPEDWPGYNQLMDVDAPGAVIQN